MRQLDIEFFWPLSEQIPLDLDYSDCEKPNHYYTHPLSGTFLISNGGVGGTTSSFLAASKLYVDVGTTVFKVDKKPNIVRRSLYKALGLKWEKK
jgi:hypothetical protein